MKRRRLLLGAGFVASAFSGCLGKRSGENSGPEGTETSTEGNNRSDSPESPVDGDSSVEYERCALTYVPLVDLPTPAKEEANTAIENDVYEIDGEVVLSEVIDVDGAYLTEYRENGWTYYDMTVTTDAGVARLRGDEIRPKKVSLPTVENGTEAEVTIDIRIEYGGDLLFKDRMPLAAGESIVLDDREDYRYGRYRAVLKIQTEEGTREEEVSWTENHVRNTGEIVVTPDEVETVTAVAGRRVCEWNEEGKLVSGPEK